MTLIIKRPTTSKLVMANSFTWSEAIWNPSMLPGVELWFDANDATTVQLSSGAVSRWNDKSTNARHIAQSTAIQQPTWNATGLNNRPTITFDGSNDILLNQNAGSIGVTNCTLIMLARYVSASGEDLSMGIGQTSQVGAARSLYRSFGGTTQGYSCWSADVTSSSLSTDTGGSFHSFIAVQANATQVKLYRDGITDSGAPRTLNGTSVAVNFNGFSMGSLQGSLVGSYYSNISISEAIVLYRAITDTERWRIEGYLAWKWGLTASLPSNHPYKTVGPTP